MRTPAFRFLLLLCCLALAAVSVVQGLYAYGLQKNMVDIAVRLYDDAVIGVSYARLAEAEFRKIQLAAAQAPSSARDAALMLYLNETMASLDAVRQHTASPQLVAALDDLHGRLNGLSERLIEVDALPESVYAEIGADIAWLGEQLVAEGAVRRLDAHVVAAEGERLIIVAMLVAVGLALAIALGFGAWLVRPFRKAIDIAASIAGGNLRTPIDARGHGEGARLMQALADMQVALNDNLARIDQLSQKAAMVQVMAMSNRLKSEFMAHMSHELRTPLNAVIGFSEIIEKQMFGPVGHAAYVDYAGDIHRAGQHLLKLVNEVLDMSKIEAGKLELQEDTVDVSDLVEACVRLVQRQADKARVAILVAAEPAIAMRADEMRLRQVVINLVSNAVKFTPEGGRVTVTAGTEDGGCTIRVADTGIGMSPEDIEKAVQPFAQVESHLTRRYEGTGLGLPIARKLVELHGGELRIESAPGRGTTVTVILPPSRRVCPAPRAA